MPATIASGDFMPAMADNQANYGLNVAVQHGVINVTVRVSIMVRVMARFQGYG